MDIDSVIAQLRTYAPVFGGRVAGAASYAAAQDQVWMDQPAAYVIPLEDEAGENQDRTGLYQIVLEKVGIVVDLKNTEDRRGQSAVTVAVDEVKTAIFKAILRWTPAGGAFTRGFFYAGGGLVGGNGVTRQWLRWQFDFSIERTITGADGWQPPSVPLEAIEGHITNPDDPLGKDLARFKVAFPDAS